MSYEAEKARHVVEEKLRLQGFIEKHSKEIHERLEQLNLAQGELKDNGGLMFLAKSLPFISSIVQVGSDLDNYRRTAKWVEDELCVSDPVPILSALTFVYIVCKGYEESLQSGNAEKIEIWERIYKRTTALFNQ